MNAYVDCVRFVFRQGIAFRGHDESENSSNQGNFLELLRFLADHNQDIKAVTLKNALENLKLTAPEIQNDIVITIEIETLNVIVKDLGNAIFSILVDESRDLLGKEQMVVVLRYVDEKWHVIERFIGIEHVACTTVLSLEVAIDSLFFRHGLSMSRLCGQGYDGTNNMQGEFNGLKTLILKENEGAFNVHCFAHQLQLALVAVTKNHIQIASLFSVVTNVVNVVVASSKRRDILHDKQFVVVSESFKHGELSRGQGLNQVTTLKRSCNTCWGSHYGTLLGLINIFSSVIEVLEIIVEDGSNSEQRYEATNLLESM